MASHHGGRHDDGHGTEEHLRGQLDAQVADGVGVVGQVVLHQRHEDGESEESGDAHGQPLATAHRQSQHHAIERGRQHHRHHHVEGVEQPLPLQC